MGPTARHGGRAPLAVKPLDDAALTAAAADDWLSSLGWAVNVQRDIQWREGACLGRNRGEARPSPASSKTTRASPAAESPPPWPACDFRPGKTRLVQHDQAEDRGGRCAARVARGGGRLASLPFLLSHPKPRTANGRQPKPEEKKTSLEDGVGSPPDKSTEKKPDCTKEPRAENPEGEDRDSQKPTPSGEQAAEDRPPEAGRNRQACAQAREQARCPPQPKTDAETAAEPKSKPPAEKAGTARQAGRSGQAGLLGRPRGGGQFAAAGQGRPTKPFLSASSISIPSSALDVQLLGGDTVAKGNPKFELQKDGDGAIPGWSVQMAEKNKDAVKIARVWQEESEWKIQWAAEAKDKATLLRYCGLQFSCEKKTHFVALSTPKTVPPLVDRRRYGRLPAAIEQRLSPARPERAPPADPASGSVAAEARDQDSGDQGASRPASAGKAGEPVPGNKVPRQGPGDRSAHERENASHGVRYPFDTHGKDVMLDMQATCEIPGGTMPFNCTSLQRAAAQVEAVLQGERFRQEPQQEEHARADRVRRKRPGTN